MADGDNVGRVIMSKSIQGDAAEGANVGCSRTLGEKMSSRFKGVAPELTAWIIHIA